MIAYAITLILFTPLISQYYLLIHVLLNLICIGIMFIILAVLPSIIILRKALQLIIKTVKPNFANMPDATFPFDSTKQGRLKPFGVLSFCWLPVCTFESSFHYKKVRQTLLKKVLIGGENTQILLARKW